jgi:hypothetical protein
MTLSRALKSLIFCMVPLLAAPLAFGQASRTWVSGVGDDANPCSRTAPCKTFAGAISKTATGGEISVLDPGGYGALTITKSITLNGDGTLASILVAGTNGIVVSAPADAVVIIRNLSINGIATGTGSDGLNAIRMIGAGELHVENVKIYGFAQQGIDHNPNGAGQLFVSNTTIRNCAGGGMWVHPVSGVQTRAGLDGVTLEGNGRGFRVEDGSTAVVRNSAAIGNDLNGFVAVGTALFVDLTLENVVSSNNGAAGVYVGPFATVRLSNVTSTHNNDGLITTGGGVSTSFGNNRINGNNGNNGPATNPVGQQ